MKKLLHIERDFQPHWVGDGFPVRSLFSYHGDTAATDPFLLLDYAAPYEFAPGTAPRGVGEHPHRGFETVTIVYQGELEHRDSGGNHGTIGPGDVQWMTAASGVVHEEFHSAAFTERGGTFEVAQLWVNLPAGEKMSPPRYQEIRARDIPQVSNSDWAGTGRVIAGEFEGIHGPAKTVTPITLCDLRLWAGGQADLPVPDGHTTMLVLQQGAVKLNGEEASGVALAYFDRAGAGIVIECTEDTRALLLSGEPLHEPVVGHGPFVMNTQEEIQQAMLDYRSGRMGSLSLIEKVGVGTTRLAGSVQWSHNDRSWYNRRMEPNHLQLTPELRQALAASPEGAVYISDQETRRVYVLVEKGKFPELEESYVRARLEEGFAAIERGEEEDWDSASIKAEGRSLLQQRRAAQ